MGMASLLWLSLVFLSARAHAASPCEIGSPDCGVGAIVSEYASQDALSGTLLLRRNGRTFHWATGLANDATATPNRRDTIFCIASISKSFVAAAILRLAELGLLDIDQPLHDFIPEYPRRHLTGANGMPVTLFTLLTHTSGIPEAYDTPWVENRIDRISLSFEQMIRPIKHLDLEFSPGSRFEYLNTGYLLLGEVVHRVSGIPYAEFLRRNFFLPLGLRHTSVGTPRDSAADVARLYERQDSGQRIDYENEYGLSSLADSPVYADTDIYTSAPDLATWIEKLTGGDVLDAESTRELLTPHQQEYGFGLVIYSDASGRLAYEHAGDYDGYQSWARHYPDEGLTTIWLGNEALSDTALDTFYESINAAALDSAW
jgi:CubicO group peptidase (beta-lactamase class C family)